MNGPASLSAALGSPVTLSANGQHNAFPGLVRCANGDLLAGWRRSGGHATEGHAYLSRSTDNGATWGTEYRPLLAYAPDYGTVTLARLSDDRIVLSAWIGDTPQARIHYSSDHGATFGASVPIAHGFTFQSVIEGPVVESANGHLLTAVWGRNTEDNPLRCSVKVVRSTDGGATFGQPVELANGPAFNRFWNEAALTVLPDGEVLCIIREETAPVTLWVCRSKDSGATWSAPTALHGHPTGRWSGAPKPTWLPELGVFIWVARQTQEGNASYLMASQNGRHFRVAPLDPGYMVYGQVCPLGGTTVGIVYANEGPGTAVADLFFRTATLTLT